MYVCVNVSLGVVMYVQVFAFLCKYMSLCLCAFAIMPVCVSVCVCLCV